jgi:hypothetical protein
MKISKANRIASALIVLAFLFVAVAGLAAPLRVRAAGGCSPATAVSVPYAKDGVADICVQTTNMCNNINSWGMTLLDINGTSYTNLYVFSSSIPASSTYAIHYVSTNPSSHFEIYAPCTIATATATNTPAGPTATFTRTNTPAGPTATFTRTNTPTAGPTLTPTRTITPTLTKTPTSITLDPHHVVDTYGRLQISQTQLKDHNGNPIQLAGMSSHGLTWFPLIDLNVNNTTNLNTLKQQITFNPAGGTPFPYTSSAVTNLVNQWHIQVIRASMFPYDPWNGADAKSYDNSYPTWKYYNINLVNAIVQSAINNNIYVIIDWHAGEGNDQDPTQYWNSGHVQEFFDYMVDKWGSYPNVIYETVNSPVVSWNPTLKTYNQNVVDHIRARENTDLYANDNLILVGTPSWSQDIDVATNDPLTGNMIAYNYMWYAGTHVPMGWVQPRGDTALANLNTRAPQQTVFMGEVGTSTSDGAGGVYYNNFNTAMEWAKTRKLSWLNWSIANKNESSAIFVPAIYATDPLNMAKNELAWRGGGLASDGSTVAQAMASTGQPMRMGLWNPADLSCSGKFVQGWMLYNTSQSTPSGC